MFIRARSGLGADVLPVPGPQAVAGDPGVPPPAAYPVSDRGTGHRLRQLLPAPQSRGRHLVRHQRRRAGVHPNNASWLNRMESSHRAALLHPRRLGPPLPPRAGAGHRRLHPLAQPPRHTPGLLRAELHDPQARFPTPTLPDAALVTEAAMGHVTAGAHSWGERSADSSTVATRVSCSQRSCSAGAQPRSWTSRW